MKKPTDYTAAGVLPYGAIEHLNPFVVSIFAFQPSAVKNSRQLLPGIERKARVSYFRRNVTQTLI